MAGIAGILGNKFIGQTINALLLDSIDPLKFSERNVIKIDYGTMVIASIDVNKSYFPKLFVDNRYVAFLFGETVDSENMAWEKLFRHINCNDKNLSDIKGSFAIAVVDKQRSTVSLISDRTSQQPLFYSICHECITFSTTLSTFCKVQKRSSFNVLWLYEMMFFNYPIGQTTFLINVLRLPPATILTYNYKTTENLLKCYAKPFKRKVPLIKGRDALEHSLSVFKKRIPKYFTNKTNNIAVSLTGGFDSRTILSLVPDELLPTLETYTYGETGCYDIEETSCLTKILKIAHKNIFLDQHFIEMLPKLIYETVMLSGGLEKINRSTLNFVFSKLTNGGKTPKSIVSGVSGDHLFRDHIRGIGNIPYLISSQMMDIFHGMEIIPNTSIFKNIFGIQYQEFKFHIRKVIKELKQLYGELNTPESYLSYLVYETGPKYFSGESSIANNYAKYISPYWDSDIINLAYEIEHSTIGFSEKYIKKDKYRECLMQAFIIEQNKKLREIPIKGGIPIKAFTCNRRIVYEMYRALIRGPLKIFSIARRKHTVYMENWELWLNETIKNEIKKLFTKDALIRKYLDDNFLDNVTKSKNIYWISKIATAEIIIGLVKNKWNV